MKKNTKRVEQTSSAKPQAATAAETGRDANGRFAAGNSGGPGNPFARQTAAFRQALRNAVTEKDMSDIACMLLFKSKSGDMVATKLLLQYCIGKPEAPVSPDRVDVDEYRLFQDQATQGEELANVLDNFPAETACRLLRALMPAISTRLGQELLEGMDERERRAALAKQEAEEQRAIDDEVEEEYERAKAEAEAEAEEAEAAAQPIGKPLPVDRLAELLRPLAAQLGGTPMANGGNGHHATAGSGPEKRPGQGRNGR